MQVLLSVEMMEAECLLMAGLFGSTAALLRA